MIRAARRASILLLIALGVARYVAAQEPPAPVAVSREQLQGAIDKLGNLDYATRMNAARTIRRAPASQAVPALLQASSDHGLVMPLVTAPSGVKFGKTESGTVWLDASRTSEQEFRQYWLTTDDRDVVTYLKYFTFLSREEIDALEAATATAPEKRAAQSALADAIGSLVHGGESAERVASANTTLFSVDLNVEVAEHAKLADTLMSIADDVPSTKMSGMDFDGSGVAVVDVVTKAGLAASKSEARRLVQQGGVKVNGREMRDPNGRLVREDALNGRVFLVQRGSRQRHVVLLT